MDRRPELGRLPVDRATFLFDFLPCELRAVTPHGIELFHTHYWHDALSCWYTRSGQTMPVRWDPRDLSRIWLELPHGEHLEVPYRDLRRPAITRWEQREAVRALRERGQQAVDETLIFQAVETQRLIVAEAAHKTKAARLALQKTKAALNDARRARSSGKLPLEQGKPATLPRSTDNGASDRQALPYLVEEMPR
jgi:putative transposase